MRECCRCNWIIILIVVIALVPVNTVVLATNTHIQTDNSLSGVTGLSVNATGPNHLYTLSEVNGQASGGNLFFSFSYFNIGNSDTAWFDLNTPDLANVISRVTGGSGSVIDGQLKMTNIASGNAPSFFFINPAGITFGASASVDVPGSFYVSTASNLNFSDDAQYPTNIVHASTLSSANPESFGFLGNESGNLNIGSSETGQTTLAFNPGTDVAFVANHIHINNAAITNADSTRAGLDMQLIATGEQADNIKLISLPDQATAGELTVQNTTLDASGNGSGRIVVRSGNFNATNSSITVNNTGSISMSVDDGINVLVGSQLNSNRTKITNDALSAGNAGLINVKADALNLRGGVISSSTISQGNAGVVTVTANKLEIDGSSDLTGILSESGGIYYGGVEGITGNAGDVIVTVSDTLKIMDSGRISTSTFSTGKGGAISVIAGQLELSKAGQITSNTHNFYGERSKGDAGDVVIAVKGMLRIIENGVIEANAFSNGRAGNVSIFSNSLEVDGIFSNISSISAFNTDKDGNFINNAGDAGNVNVTILDTIKLINGGTIRAGTFTEGKGGNVTVTAKNIEINSHGISSDSLNWDDAGNPIKGGDAGSVTITAFGTLKLIDGAQISTSTFSKGKAGKVTVSAGQLDINGQYAGIFSQSRSNNSFANTAVDVGDAGDVTVTVKDTLRLFNGGLISTSTSGSTGKAGIVTVNTGRLEMNHSEISSSADLLSTGQTGSINIRAENDIRLSNDAKISVKNAATTTNSKTATGNININLSDNSVLYLDNSSVSTVSNIGDSGSITINGSNAVYLHNSPIITSVLGQSGDGGDINITSNALIMDTGFIQANTQAAKASGGKIAISEPTMIIPSGNFLLIGGNQEDFTPFSGRNVIQAVAPNGQSVSPVVGAPQLNLSGTLANLNIESFDTGAMNHDMCSIDTNSSLLLSGKGGQRPRAKDFLLSTMQ